MEIPPQYGGIGWRWILGLELAVVDSLVGDFVLVDDDDVDDGESRLRGGDDAVSTDFNAWVTDLGEEPPLIFVLRICCSIGCVVKTPCAAPGAGSLFLGDSRAFIGEAGSGIFAAREGDWGRPP